MTLTIESPAGPYPTLCVQPTHVTRRAEKQVGKLLRELSPGDRERLVTDLPRPVHYRSRDIITSRKKHRLYHFRLRCEVAIRVCYLLLSGADAVILDVAMHDEFDKYVNNFSGSYGTVIPIEESRIMKQVTTNGTAPGAPKNVSAAGVPVTANSAQQPVIPPSPPPPVTPASAPVSEPTYPDLAEVMVQSILRAPAFKKQLSEIDDTVEKLAGDARDEAVSAINVTLQNIESRLTGQCKAFEMLRGDLAGLHDRLTATIEGVGGHRTELEAELEALRESLCSGDAGLARAIAKCEGDITTAGAGVRTAEVRLDDFSREIEARLEGQGAAFEGLQAVIAGLRGGLNGLTAGIATHRGEIDASLQAIRESFASGDDGLAGAIAGCDRDITAIRAGVSHLEGRLGEVDRKFEARLGVIDAALAEDRTAPLAARLDRLAEDKERLVCREDGREARLATAIDLLAECREETSNLQSTLAASDARARTLEDQVTTLQRSFQELVGQVARERREREQRSIKGRLGRLIDYVRSSLMNSGRRRCGA